MPTSLTSDQKADLMHVIRDAVGANADFAVFSAHLLGLCEDIPGFETIAPCDALIHEIWRLYR
ncbi:hypothetical protein VSR82_38685 [Burkholderia sp. JPY481]